MTTTDAGSRREQPVGWVTLGTGWQWPAAFVAIMLLFLYVPAHDPSAGAVSDLAATAALLYVAGLSIVGVRLLRGLILRAGGSRDPIVLLGSGPDPLISGAIRARWRLAAVAAGAVAPAAVAMAAFGLDPGGDPATPAHAIVSLALGVNLAVAAGVLVPAPGFPGWALLLAMVDATGVGPDRRLWRAARLARVVGVPIALVAAVLVGLLGDPMLMFLGLALAFLTWNGGQVAAARDATARFLGAHVAGDLTRPVVVRAAPDEPAANLLARARTDTFVATVEGDRGVVGAIGPRQVAGRTGRRLDERCSELMVSLESLNLVNRSAPAGELLPELARHGFALVREPDGLGYVEAADVGRQVRIWLTLRERPASAGNPDQGSSADAGDP